MKSAPAATKAFLESGQRIGFRADLFTLTLQDGITTYRWTNCEASLPGGGNLWLAGDGQNAPLVKASPFRQSARLTIDTMDLTLTPGAFRIGGKTLGQLARERYFSGARIQRDHLVGPDVATALVNGPIPKLFEGRVGALSPAGAQFTMRCKSELIALNVITPRYRLQGTCGNVVYDPDCGLSRAAFTFAGTASGVPTVSSIATTSAAVIANATGYFDLGVLTFTSGALTGASMDVASYVLSGGTGTFTLATPLARAPAAADTFTVTAGCDRKKVTCGPGPYTGLGTGKFNNLAQYRGYPRIPSPESGS